MIKHVWKREGGNCMCDTIDARSFLEVFNFYIYTDINEFNDGNSLLLVVVWDYTSQEVFVCR